MNQNESGVIVCQARNRVMQIPSSMKGVMSAERKGLEEEVRTETTPSTKITSVAALILYICPNSVRWVVNWTLEVTQLYAAGI